MIEIILKFGYFFFYRLDTMRFAAMIRPLSLVLLTPHSRASSWGLLNFSNVVTRNFSQCQLVFSEIWMTESNRDSRVCGVIVARSPSLSVSSAPFCRASTSAAYLAPVRCAYCNAESSSSSYVFFCPKCDSVLPADRSRSYFDVVNSPATYDVDVKALTLHKRHLLRKLHPDKFALSSPDELKRAADQSAVINEAAAQLTNPYKRGAYLLQLRGAPISEGTRSDLGQGFLLEMMELNENVEGLSSAEDTERMCQELGEIVAVMEKELNRAFSGGNIDNAKQILEKMKFYINLEEKCRELLTKF